MIGYQEKWKMLVSCYYEKESLNNDNLIEWFRIGKKYPNSWGHDYGTDNGQPCECIISGPKANLENKEFADWIKKTLNTETICNYH